VGHDPRQQLHSMLPENKLEKNQSRDTTPPQVLSKVVSKGKIDTDKNDHNIQKL
jgi:hypothetical protein